MQKVIRTHLLPYGIALLSVAAVLLLTFLIEPLRTKTNYMLFFGAVMVSAWYGGLWPGLLAVLLSTLSSAYFFLPPFYSLGLKSWDDLLRLGMFVIMTVLISSLNESRHRAEAATRRSEKWFSTTLKSIGDAVIVTDSQGSVTFMNPVAETLTGWKQEEATGKSIKEIFNIV